MQSDLLGMRRHRDKIGEPTDELDRFRVTDAWQVSGLSDPTNVVKLVRYVVRSAASALRRGRRRARSLT
jgi:hypothetical protein